MGVWPQKAKMGFWPFVAGDYDIWWLKRGVGQIKEGVALLYLAEGGRFNLPPWHGIIFGKGYALSKNNSYEEIYRKGA